MWPNGYLLVVLALQEPSNRTIHSKSFGLTSRRPLGTPSWRSSCLACLFQEVRTPIGHDDFHHRRIVYHCHHHTRAAIDLRCHHGWRSPPGRKLQNRQRGLLAVQGGQQRKPHNVRRCWCLSHRMHAWIVRTRNPSACDVYSSLPCLQACMPGFASRCSSAIFHHTGSHATRSSTRACRVPHHHGTTSRSCRAYLFCPLEPVTERECAGCSVLLLQFFVFCHSFAAMGEHCADEFAKQWECLDVNNMQFNKCRKSQSPLDVCVFTKMVRNLFYPTPCII